jgi:hypothetical protein
VGGRSGLLFLFFFFIYTHELTAHARFFCCATNVAMLLHDAHVRSPLDAHCLHELYTRHTPREVRRVAQDNPWLTSLFF